MIALGLDEGILLDRDGYLSEATGENLFIVLDGMLITTPDEAPVLHGITRDTVLTLARDSQIPIELARFGRSYLYYADEAFLTGTAAEVTPVREVDGRDMGAPGEITKRLQAAHLDVVRGKGERVAEWVTRV